MNSALDAAVKAYSAGDNKHFNIPAKVAKARLNYLMWRVISGRCSDFFDASKSFRTEEIKVTNPWTGAVEIVKRDIYSTSPQWANPRLLTLPGGEEYQYIHCRYRGDK